MQSPTAGRRFNHAGNGFILEFIALQKIVTTTPASPRLWHRPTTAWYRYTPVSLLISQKRIMDLAVWWAAEAPNLVGPIFKGGREMPRISREN